MEIGSVITYNGIEYLVGKYNPNRKTYQLKAFHELPFSQRHLRKITVPASKFR